MIVTLGLIGILLIALSQLTSSQKAAPQATSSPQSDEAYCKDLEEKIVQLVSAITGDRECVVAVTLENGSQYVYADQNKIDSDQTEDKADGGISTRESRKSEQEYIIIKGEDGVQTALVVTEKKPSVRGGRHCDRRHHRNLKGTDHAVGFLHAWNRLPQNQHHSKGRVKGNGSSAVTQSITVGDNRPESYKKGAKTNEK